MSSSRTQVVQEDRSSSKIKDCSSHLSFLFGDKVNVQDKGFQRDNLEVIAPTLLLTLHGSKLGC